MLKIHKPYIFEHLFFFDLVILCAKHKTIVELQRLVRLIFFFETTHFLVGGIKIITQM